MWDRYSSQHPISRTKNLGTMLDLPLSTVTVDSPAGSEYRETENQLLQLQVEPRTSTPEIQPHWRKPWTCHEILGINGSEWFLVKRCWGAFKNPAKDSSCKENKTYTLCYMLPTTFYQKQSIDTRIPLERNHAHQVQSLGFLSYSTSLLYHLQEKTSHDSQQEFLNPVIQKSVCSLDPWILGSQHDGCKSLRVAYLPLLGPPESTGFSTCHKLAAMVNYKDSST